MEELIKSTKEKSTKPKKKKKHQQVSRYSSECHVVTLSDEELAAVGKKEEKILEPEPISDDERKEEVTDLIEGSEEIPLQRSENRKRLKRAAVEAVLGTFFIILSRNQSMICWN